MIALLYYNIKTPSKETHALKVLDFEVSIHADIDAANFWAYYHYGLGCKEHSDVELTPMLSIAWNNRFKFAVFLPHTIGTVYKANAKDWRFRGTAWRLVNTDAEELTGVGTEMSERIPEFILPEGYKIMESGVITEGCKMFYSGNNPFKNDEYVEHWCRDLVGQELAYLQRNSQQFVYYSTSQKNLGEKLLTRRNPIIIKPI
jgi:hypothetical protein